MVDPKTKIIKTIISNIKTKYMVVKQKSQRTLQSKLKYDVMLLIFRSFADKRKDIGKVAKPKGF